MNFAFLENSNQSLGGGVPNGETKETYLRGIWAWRFPDVNQSTKMDWTGLEDKVLYLLMYSLHVGHIQVWKICDSDLVTLLNREFGWFTDCCLSSIESERSSAIIPVCGFKPFSNLQWICFLVPQFLEE